MAMEQMTEQQLRIAADLAWNSRWQFAWDMNGDGLVTVADGWLWLKWIVLAPGDFLLLQLMMHAAPVASFLQLRPGNSLAAFLSALISAIVWLFAASARPTRAA